jgi:hypothetical protein
MELVREVYPSMSALARHLEVARERLGVKKYCYDERIQWDTYLVTIDGQAVGFTDELPWNV